LHWISAADLRADSDTDLGLAGSAPAISADASFLAYIGLDGGIHIYRPSTRMDVRLGSDNYQALTIGGTAIFAVRADGSLIRIDTTTGESAVWLPPFPEVTTATAVSYPVGSCSIACYGPPQIGYDVSPGMLLILNGTGFGDPGWQATIGGMAALSGAVSDTVAWVQVPSIPPQDTTLAISIPNYPMQSTLQLSVSAGTSPYCLATLHQNFDSLVSRDSPAHPGESVHVFLTGLQGAPPVPYGTANPVDHLVPVANPPALADPGAAYVLFLGLAPGLLAEQQLDLQILRPFNSYSLFAPNQYLSACSPPPVHSQSKPVAK
jgi:uncharacterized protein (TIGR03437 family)